jgi:hypothetical protein
LEIAITLGDRPGKSGSGDEKNWEGGGEVHFEKIR